MSFDCPAFFGGSPVNLLRSSKYKYVPSRHRGNQKKNGPLKERSHLLLPAPSSCSPLSSLCAADSPITLPVGYSICRILHIRGSSFPDTSSLGIWVNTGNPPPSSSWLSLGATPMFKCLRVSAPPAHPRKRLGSTVVVLAVKAEPPL